MLQLFKDLLDRFAEEEHLPADSPDCGRVAGALMMQLAAVDSSVDEEEIEVIRRLLTREFHIEGEELETLVKTCWQNANDSTSLYEFTSSLNNVCNVPQKEAMLHAMWKLALADGNVDKFEEHFIRRVADLLYLGHEGFIRTKLKVIGE